MLSVPSSKMPSHVSKTPNLRKAYMFQPYFESRNAIPLKSTRSSTILDCSPRLVPDPSLFGTEFDVATKQYNRYRWMIPLQRQWKRLAEG